MLPRLLSVLKQFPFSADRPGMGYLGSSQHLLGPAHRLSANL